MLHIEIKLWVLFDIWRIKSPFHECVAFVNDMIEQRQFSVGMELGEEFKVGNYDCHGTDKVRT